jgi:hypothetical protein
LLLQKGWNTGGRCQTTAEAEKLCSSKVNWVSDLPCRN